jgi:hypothetical protein
MLDVVRAGLVSVCERLGAHGGDGLVEFDCSLPETDSCRPPSQVDVVASHPADLGDRLCVDSNQQSGESIARRQRVGVQEVTDHLDPLVGGGGGRGRGFGTGSEIRGSMRRCCFGQMRKLSTLLALVLPPTNQRSTRCWSPEARSAPAVFAERRNRSAARM